MSCDVLVIGGGIIGLSTALRLADDDVSVTVLDRGEAGREASWAGAGMLPPALPQPGRDGTRADDREFHLRSLSNTLWPDLSDRLRLQTGIDNGYCNSGSLELCPPGEDLNALMQTWQADGVAVEQLSGRDELDRLVPGLHPSISSAAFLPEFCQVRNPRHLNALKAACQLSGVELLEHVPDVRLNATGSRVTATTSDHRYSTERICVTAGAWTRQLLQPLNVSLDVRPVRGQMAQLQLPQLPFRCVIEQGRRYLVPRSDGLILVGSTEEDAEFEKQTTADGIRGLLDFAFSIVPDLSQAELVRQWAGLRPGSPTGLPYLGRIDGFDNLYVGAGHFRNGLQMSPGTALLLANMLVTAVA